MQSTKEKDQKRYSNIQWHPGMTAQAYNPTTYEAESEYLQIQGLLELQSKFKASLQMTPYLKMTT